ncbi:hypothetical protein IFR05_005714 [Cadophora sp. M221]|nr:hypothetical protein IFR05_005714 [Cadophora sp. M221]
MLPTRPSESSPPLNPFVFPTGTVKLLATYKGQSLVGSVSADALVLASPVWKKFLFPPWNDTSVPEKETEVKQKQIDCTEDDGEALLILLNIVHLNFDGVPPVLKYSTLVEVAMLVDQYDCIKVVRPWLESWMKDEKSESLKAKQEGWLFISWVFGREATFSGLARHMVLNCTIRVSKSLELVYMKREPIIDLMPPGIIENVIKCRNEALDDLLDILYRRLAKLEAAMRSSKPVCSVDQDCKVCDAALYGAIIFGLTECAPKLYPRPHPESLIECSVNDVAALLLCIEIHHIKPKAPVVAPAVAPVVTPVPARGGLFGSAPGPSFGVTAERQPANPFSFGGSHTPQVFGSLAPRFGTQSSPQSTPPNPPKAPKDHSQCTRGVRTPVGSILHAIRSPILDSHRLHMKIQRGEAVNPAA